MTAVAVLAGGVGAARFLSGLVQVVDPASVTAIVNTADDTVMHGLHVSPDLDTVTYTLAGAIDRERGWGLSGETWTAMGALARYTPQRPTGSTAGGTWFNLGDQDLATHLYRTGRLAEGATLSEVTREIAASWAVPVRLLPMTDRPVRTVLRIPGEGELSFQEYFVGRRHDVPVESVRFAGIDDAVPAPGVLEALETAVVVAIAPSNPIVSIGPILAVPGVRELLAARRSSVVAVSPIVGGKALKGPADRLLVELGSEASVAGVARAYAGVCGTLVIDELDADLADRVEAEGLTCVVTRTIMSEPGVGSSLARAVLGAGGGR